MKPCKEILVGASLKRTKLRQDDMTKTETIDECSVYIFTHRSNYSIGMYVGFWSLFCDHGLNVLGNELCEYNHNTY